jgi:BRCA1-associated RING domain protein 1
MESSMRRFLNPLVLNLQKMELELTCPVWYRTSPSRLHLLPPILMLSGSRCGLRLEKGIECVEFA